MNSTPPNQEDVENEAGSPNEEPAFGWHEEEENEGPPVLDRGFIGMLTAAVGLILAAAWVSEMGALRYDLQIAAPSVVRPGAPLPLRAHLLDRASPGALPLESIELELYPAPEGEVEQTERYRPAPELESIQTWTIDNPSLWDGVEGRVTVPGVESGDYVLFARAQVGGEDSPQTVAHPLQIATDPRPPLPVRGNRRYENQRYALLERSGEDAPEQLDARFVGGSASLDGEEAELLVWVGEGAAEIRLEAVEGMGTVSFREDACESGETSGVVRCLLRAEGDHAQLDVVAFRSGVEVGRRRVQLPMGTNAPRISVPSLIAPDARDARLEVQHIGDIAIDIFHESAWVDTRSGQDELTFQVPVAPGLWLAQARDAPLYGTDHHMRRFFVGTLEELAHNLAGIRAQQRWPNPISQAIADGRFSCAPAESVHCSDERIARFMLSGAEYDGVEGALYTRGLAQAQERDEGKRNRQRGLAGFLIVLAGILVAIAVGRRGLRASKEADTIREDGKVSRAPVFGASLFVVACFVAAAMIVMARGCF